MGANESTVADEFIISRRPQKNSAYPTGKPNPPEGIPKVSEITHNALILTWMSPMNSGNIIAYQVECCKVQDRKWKVVSSTCQGTNYHVRNLLPNTQYAFRVRAENICGLSKPGHISNIVETHTEVLGLKPAKVAPKLVRRHSHYLRVDGGVNSLLNGVDQTDMSSVGSIPFRRNSMRGSLPATFRKRNSVTSMLPGSQRESIFNMKESKRSFEESSVTEEDGINLKRISLSSTEGSSILSATSMNSIQEDDEFKSLYDGSHLVDYKDISSDNDDASSIANSQSSHGSTTHSTHSSHSSSSSSHCFSTSSSNFLNASITDDSKLAYYSHPVKQCYPDNYCNKLQNSSTNYYDHCNNEMVWKGQDELDNQRNRNNVPDLRSIRQMLHSQDVMVKTLDCVDNPYPEYISNRRTHCSIKEMDEEHVAMDIVSTI